MRLIVALVFFVIAGCSVPAETPTATAASDFIDLLAQTNAKIEQFQFSPDGARIAYVSARSGSYDVWVMNSDGSNARAITGSYPEAESNPMWSPDGKWIAYSSRDEIFLVSPEDPEHPINMTYGTGSNFVQWMPDSKAMIVSRRGGLGLLSSDIPIRTSEPKMIIQPGFGYGEPTLSPDGKWFAFSSNQIRKSGRWRNDIWLVPSSGGTPKLLTPGTDESEEYNPRWSPDGTKLVFVSDKSGWANIGVIDVASGQIKMLTNSPWDEGNPQWSPDGRTIGYIANKKWSLYVMKVSADGGQPQQLTEREGIAGGFEATQVRGTFRWSPDGRSIAYTFMGPATSNDIWTISADGGTPKRLTNHMPEGLSEDQFVTPEIITYKSKDGVEIPAFLYKPKSIPADRRPPLLLYLHAFTHGMHVNGFYPFIQLFASRGYVVLAPNFRGSAGLGAAFEKLNYGDWGGGDIDDIAAGVEHLAAQGMIDPARVVVQGGSTGGYLTMQTIVKYPDLTKAAVNFYGPTTLIDMWYFYGNRALLNDIATADRGGPEEAPEHWRERSATPNIDRIKTPLMLMWGDRDYGVRLSMPDQYYRLAKEKGKATEYVLYSNEPHGWYAWRPENLKDAMIRVAAHYQKYTGQ